MITQRGIAVNKDLQSDLVTIMNDNDTDICDTYQQGTFPHIFWEQQRKASQLKNPKSMRWEPAMIRWCLYLRHPSSTAYEILS